MTSGPKDDKLTSASPHPAPDAPTPVLADRPPVPPDQTNSGRRDFFNDAMREAMAPLAGLLEWRFGPILRALDEIPTQLDAATTQMVGALDQLGGKPAAPPRTIPLKVERYLRPPGAPDEESFASVCTRCGKCVDACPAAAIKLDANGLIADGLPYIVAAERPCVVCTELACMPACPSGALSILDQFHIRMGLAKVNQSTCLRSQGEDCQLCVNACPVREQAIEISPINGRVRVKKGLADHPGCVGCGLCERVCPTDPASIIVIPRSDHHDPIIA